MPTIRLRNHLILYLLLSTATPDLLAQANTGDVVGTVIDVAGAVLPDARVTIKNTNTGVSQTVQTGNTGDYGFSLLQVGSYDLTIEAKGFRTFAAKGLNLSAGDRVRVDGRWNWDRQASMFRFRPKRSRPANRLLHHRHDNQ